MNNEVSVKGKVSLICYSVLVIGAILSGMGIVFIEPGTCVGAKLCIDNQEYGAINYFYTSAFINGCYESRIVSFFITGAAHNVPAILNKKYNFIHYN